MKKQILLLCQYFFPEYISSAQLPTNLATFLVKKGFNVNVICGWPYEYTNDCNYKKVEDYKGVNIRRVKYQHKDKKNKWGRLMNYLSFFLRVLLKLPTILKFDLVIIYSNPPILPLLGYFIKKFGHAKFIFVGFDLYPDNALAIGAISKDSFIVSVMKKINSKVYTSVDKVVAISEDMKEYLLNKYSQLNEQKIVVIHNWYTEQNLHTGTIMRTDFREFRKKYNLILVYAGNIGEAQEIDTILNSSIEIDRKNMQNILIIFAGHGSRKNELELTIREKELTNIKIYDFLEGQDYVDLLNCSDVCLVSLRKGVEGLGVPSKTYGYFAFGKPVISIMAKETELAKLIEKENAGVNLIQGDVPGFIATIEKMMQNKEWLHSLGQNSSNLHNNYFHRDIALNKYSNLISDFT